jgi:hypothetical protein
MVGSYMIISRKKRFIFAAFNKTGSTSIEDALSGYNSRLLSFKLSLFYKILLREKQLFKHARPLNIKKLLGEDEWNRYYKFSFIRNPWSRAVSLYHYHRKSPIKYPLAQLSFEEWVEGGGTGTARKSMFDFICDESGNVIIDFVGRYENLATDFAHVCAKIGVKDATLPHLNRSSLGTYVDYYSEKSRNTVGEWAAKDIEAFGYKFEE